MFFSNLHLSQHILLLWHVFTSFILIVFFFSCFSSFASVACRNINIPTLLYLYISHTHSFLTWAHWASDSNIWCFTSSPWICPRNQSLMHMWKQLMTDTADTFPMTYLCFLNLIVKGIIIEHLPTTTTTDHWSSQHRVMKIKVISSFYFNMTSISASLLLTKYLPKTQITMAVGRAAKRLSKPECGWECLLLCPGYVSREKGRALPPEPCPGWMPGQQARSWGEMTSQPGYS